MATTQTGTSGTSATRASTAGGMQAGMGGQVPDTTYNLISVMYHTLQGCQTYEQYAQDAEQAGQQEIAQAQSATAGVNFSQAVPGLQAYFDQNHTYVGATLPAGSGVVLVSASATSYCLQDGNEHEVGPAGTPQPGPC